MKSTTLGRTVIWTRRRVVASAAIVGAGAISAACDSGARPGAAPAGKRPVTLTYHARTGPQGEYFRGWAARYSAQEPHVTINHEHFPAAEYHEKLTVLLSGGTIGDAVWGSSIQTFGLLTRASALSDLQPIVKREKFDLGVFYPQATQGLTTGGKLYGLPWAVHPGRMGVFLSPAAFDRAGQKPPPASWTTTEMLTLAQRLTSTSGDVPSYGFAPGTDLFAAVCWIRSFGGDYLSADGKQLTIDTPPALQALQFVADLYGRQKVAPAPGAIPGMNNNQALGIGRLAMLQAGYWVAQTIRLAIPGVALEATMLPNGPAGSRGMFEFDWNGVTAASKQPDAAFAWCAYLTGEEPGLDAAVTSTVPGARRSVWEHPSLMKDPVHQAFARALPAVPPLLVPANGRGIDLQVEWAKQMAALWTGDTVSARAVVEQALPPLRAIVGG